MVEVVSGMAEITYKNIIVCVIEQGDTGTHSPPILIYFVVFTPVNPIKKGTAKSILILMKFI